MTSFFAYEADESQLGVQIPRLVASDPDADTRRPSFHLASAEPPRKRRRGGKIYSGCGTCRARKIKCDNRQPQCWNCERSRRYECDGYSDLPTQTQQQGSSPSIFSIMDDILAGDEADFGDADLPWDEFNAALANGPASASLDAPRTFDNVQELDGSPFRVLETPSIQQPDDPAPLLDLDNHTEAHLPSLDLDASPSTVRDLLDHYRTHVCGLMMPTTAPSRNPWLHLYLPLALRGPADSPNEALLYGILSVSAHNKAHLTASLGEKQKYREQGKDYGEKAAATLRGVLQSGRWEFDLDGNQDLSHALMAAALTLTTIEVFSGSSKGDWHRHLRLCKQVIDMTGGLTAWLANPTCLTLLQIFRCLQIVASTSDRSDDGAAGAGAESLFLLEQDLAQAQRNLLGRQHLQGEQDGDGQKADDEGRELLDKESSTSLTAVRAAYPLDVTFGVSMLTLRCLTRINDLSRFKTSLGPSSPWPQSKLSSLHDLERDIFDPFDDPSTFSGETTGAAGAGAGLEGVSDCVADFIKENHLWAFHYATAIFFRRALSSSLPPSSSQQTSRPSGQHLISLTLDHLETIDSLSRDVPIANTLWPGFIAAVEAVHISLRHRALVWLSRAKSHGIGNISQAMGLVMEVWRRVDRQIFRRHAGKGEEGGRVGMEFELAGVDWRQVMRERDMYIMLT